MNATREDKTRRTNDDREDRKGDTLVAERALRESICFFLFCAWKECGFCSICVCFSRGVTSVCG